MQLMVEWKNIAYSFILSEQVNNSQPDFFHF